jgi:hypothetical protein
MSTPTAAGTHNARFASALPVQLTYFATIAQVSMLQLFSCECIQDHVYQKCRRPEQVRLSSGKDPATSGQAHG